LQGREQSQRRHLAGEVPPDFRLRSLTVPSFRTGTVDALLAERPGLQRVTVDGDRAYVLTQLIGPVAVGDRVVCNTTAVDLGLGTGGWHVVHWNLSRDSFDGPGGGHIMKLRYTSLQVDTGAADGPGLRAGTPVVACALHSQVAVVAHAFKQVRPDASLTYVMTDSAALPLALSDLVFELRAAGLLDATITAGQAFGGEREAVNVRSALELVDDGAVVVGPGPGVVGTGTTYGFGSLEVAAVLDAAVDAGGVGIVALRYSDADPRPRHQGVSHHSTTALALVHQDVLAAYPAGGPPPVLPQGTPVAVPVPDLSAVTATTMGRGPADDPGFYAYAGAAGALAASRVPLAPS
jgi:hypothetical protein